jgi:hypothetical protein
MKTQNNVYNTVQELKSSLTEIQSKADTILNNQAQSPTAQVRSNLCFKIVEIYKNYFLYL